MPDNIIEKKPRNPGVAAGGSLPATYDNPVESAAIKNYYNEPRGSQESNFSIPTEQNYGDITGNKSEYKPNSEGKANTGSGVEAAVGTQYSWDKTGADKARASYSADVLTKKQDMLTNRQTIENNAVNYQAQADMMKYQSNQNAEKVGWTGGYVLDQNRQMEYLKESIQAQMYGAMQLQMAGKEYALASARLAYDLNQKEYAQQYYQEAVTAALGEAQLTGVYFSAETKDMMGQISVADQNLMRIGAIDKDGNPIEGFDPEKLSPEDKEAYKQANNVKNSITNWFSANGISKEGVKTLAAWQQDQDNELQWSQELWTRYNAALESAKTDIQSNASEFIMLDENGKEYFDGNNIATGNWDTMNGQDIVDYMNTSTYATNQYYGYLDSTITGSVESGFTKWCQTKGLITTDKDGKQTTSDVDYTTYLSQYLKDSDVLNKFKEKFKDVSATDVYKKIGNWDFNISLPDGKILNIRYNDLIEGNFGDDSDSTEDTSTKPINIDGKNIDVKEKTTDKTSVNNYKAKLNDNMNVSLTSFDVKNIDSNNISIKIGDKTYDVGLGGQYSSSDTKLITEFVTKTKGSTSEPSLLVINDELVYCSNNLVRKIDGSCGSADGLIEAVKEAKQWSEQS